MQSQQSKYLAPKLKLLPLLVLLATGIICFRLFQLQIQQTDQLYSQSEKNCTRIEKIQPPRGNIVDTSGILLATNRPLTNLYWQGQGGRLLTAEHLDQLEKIGKIINKPLTEDLMFLETIKKSERTYTKLQLAADLTFEQLSQIKEQFTNNSSIIISTHFKRFYPYNTFACHILGYLGTIHMEQEGKMGLEKMYEETLKGQDGAQIKKITSTGRSLAETQLKEALTGNTIKTTIDIDIQNIVEQIFPEKQAGTFILMDPEDGAIVSLVSRPNFDPNVFLDPISPQQWQELQQKQPFLNRAFNSCYPPGSIFKLISTCAALEHGIISPESLFCCNGYITFAERRYWCNCKHGHGTMNTLQALAKSCNILYFEIAKKISIDTLAEYAHKFGLGEKTGICFPEKEGLIPSTQWKRETKGERWWPGETLSAIIGQSYNLVTPIQVARMIASIFTGYLVAPRILFEEAINKTILDIKKSTLEFLRTSMKSVVTRGTGINVSHVKDIEIFAKTSTAQVCGLGKNLSDAFAAHGWFVAYFRYKDSKPLVMVVMAENVGSSSVAADIAKNFLIEYKDLMDGRTRN